MILINNGEAILFYENMSEGSIYEIPINSIGEIIIQQNLNCSDWVLHLMKKMWCPTETLYEFASMVRKLEMDKKIDWYSTFRIVEYKQYLHDANELKDAANTHTEAAFGSLNSTDMFDVFRFNAEDDKEISEPIIDKIVREKLQKYKLV